MTPIDQAARDRIGDDLDATLFVEAGAGTGKTSALVERVVNLVARGVSIGEIAAITFTESAAAELRDRIRSRLIEAGHDRAAADVDGAAISTLHAFAHRILAEHPVEVGLPPQVEILDEVRSQLAFEERWERFVDALMARDDMEEAIIRAHLCGVAIESRHKAASTLKDVARVFDENWDRLDGYVEASGGPLAAVDGQALVPHLDAVLDLPGSCADPDDKLLAQIQDEGATLEAARAAVEAGDDRALITLLFRKESWKCSYGKADNWRALPGAADEARDRTADLQEERARLKAEITNDVLRRLGGAVAAATVDAATERRAAGRLEFHDLLVLARRLVRTSPAALAALHERYRRILLDEFQDTDPIQIELASSIAGGGDGQGPHPGRLFLVGDAKQSIYRFRRADIAVFQASRDRYGGDGLVELSQNFRTVEPVLDAVNDLFDHLMPEEGEGRPRYAPLSADRPGHGSVDQRPIMLGECHEDKPKADELRQREAADVAGVVADVVARPHAWPVYDTDTDRWRPARPDDVTVLIPARTSLVQLQRALDAVEVPHRADTGTLVFDTQEVRDLLATLAAIADPTDEVSLVAALRSPLFGCGDDDLWVWHRGGGSWDVARPIPDALVDSPVGRAVAWLSERHRDRWWHEPSALLEQIARERRAFELGFAGDRPRDVWRRTRFLIEQARHFEESEAGDLREFLAWAELQRQEASKAHEPVQPEADDRSVRIMTIHGAKGLEFPITIVSGLTTQLGRRRGGPGVLWGEDATPEIRLKADVRTDQFDRLADFEGEMDERERIRLLYVAMTRARDHLVVSGHHLPSRTTYAKLVWERSEGNRRWRTFVPGAMPEADDLDTTHEEEPAPVSAPDWSVSTADERQAWIDGRAALLESQRRGRSLSATAAARLVDRVSTEPEGDPVDENDPLLAGDERPVWRRGRAGTAVGRAVHSVLEAVDLATGEGVDELALGAAVAEAVPGAAGLVATKVRSALRSEAVREATASPRMWRELYVAAPVADRTLEGYIDLLYEGPRGLVVVDHKTDEMSEEKLAYYGHQGAAYALALEHATGRTVTECRFVFAREGDPVERVVDDLDAAKARVLAQIGGLSPSPAPG